MSVGTSEFAALSAADLNEAALSIRRSQAGLNWSLAMVLLALDAVDGFRQLGCGGGIAVYARTRLHMNPQKAFELLRAARALRSAPRMSDAFRSGNLSWSKIRELTRHVTAANDEELTAWGLEHTADEIQRAAVMSPRRWKAEQAEKTPVPAPGGQPAAAGALFDMDGERTTADDRQFSDSPVSSRPGAEYGHGTAGVAEPELPPTSPGKPTGESVLPSALRKKTLIAVNLQLEAEDFALWEKAKAKVYATKRKRVSAAVVVRELCHRFLTTGSGDSNLRHQVVLEVNPAEGTGWYRTERGILPASEDAVAAALKTLAKEGEHDTASCPEAPQPGSQERPSPQETENHLPGEPAADIETHESGVMPHGTEALFPTDEAQDASESDLQGDILPSANASAEAAASGGQGHGQDGSAPTPFDTQDSTGKQDELPPCDRPPTPETRGGKKSRRVPRAVVRALYRRARGCCEMPGCQNPTGLHIHHRVPFSEGGKHELANLLLLCTHCHDNLHVPDFNTRPHWQAARARARANVSNAMRADFPHQSSSGVGGTGRQGALF